MTTQKQLWTIINEKEELTPNTLLSIQEDEFHYIVNVLRLKTGEEIEVTNCQGIKALAKIELITKKEIKLLILNTFPQNKQTPEIHLYLALPKPSTLEELVSSASEIGVDEIHLFRTEKCASKAPVKLEKLQRISNEAVRISKSTFSSKIFYYDNMKELIQTRKKEFTQGVNLFCDESHVYENKVTNSLLKVLLENFNLKENINLLIGPEASFSENERNYLLQNINCHSVSLGNNILRVPTAASIAIGVAIQARSYSIFEKANVKI